LKRLASFEGVFVPMVTPIFDDDTIDVEGMQGLAQRFLDSPFVDGLFALGVTGEYMHLAEDERRALIKALGQVKRSGKVIAVNTGGLAMEEVLSLSEYAGEAELDAVGVVVPLDEENTPQAMFRYYERVGRIGIPFLVYWPPRLKDHYPTTEIVETLMEIPSYIGLKDSSRDMEMFSTLCFLYGEEISVFQGIETLHLPSLPTGSAGVIGGGLNLYPKLLALITEAFHENRLWEARKLQLKVRELWYSLNRNNSFRWVCKKIWHEQGVIRGTHCREGREDGMTPAEMEEMRSMLLV
jgi:4-hydroxy-tetrahydrodipicolinate synthase